MIRIEGQQEGSEYEAALSLRELFLRAWPWIEADQDNQVVLVVGVQCHGQTPRDLDLVLLANLPGRPQFQARFHPDPRAPENTPSPAVRVESLCVAFEIKEHDPRSVRFRATEVEVAYNRPGGAVEWKSATHQSERQKYSLKNYLDTHVGSSPWVGNLIWLRNVPSKDLPRGPNNILPSKFTLNGLLNWVAETTRLNRDGHEFVLTATRLGDELPILSAVQFLTARIHPTALDRRRMDRIVQASLDSAWLQESNNQQLLLRGRGGTGKTMLLLQLAWRIHNERGAKILFLTYNHALLADLRRLMTLLGISDDISTPRFQVRTAHSFFHSVLLALGVVTPTEDFLNRYEELKTTALQYLEAGVLGKPDLEALQRGNPDTFDWDKILVDEGQDWPRNEMLLLRQLHGTTNLAIADGIDQLVRQDYNCDWLEGLRSAEYRVAHLQAGLRMKRNLASFANSVASSLGLAGWEVSPSEDATGGRVIIVEGDYFSVPSLHTRLKAEAAALGNDPVDMLACVPPSLVIKNADKRVLSIGPQFAALGQDIWDGTDADTRSNSYPLSAKQLRVVQYDSCRGLEGWTCLHFSLDSFFDHKAALWTPSSGAGTGLLQDDPGQARRFAARWLMIPLTRAMDTLVIHLQHPNSYLTDVLRDLADDQCKDFVEWIKTGGATK